MTSTSWKTTSAGIAMIVGGLAIIVFAIKNGTLDETKVTAATTAILAGVGLVVAKDSDVTGGSRDSGKQPDTQAQPPPDQP